MHGLKEPAVPRGECNVDTADNPATFFRRVFAQQSGKLLQGRHVLQIMRADIRLAHRRQPRYQTAYHPLHSPLEFPDPTPHCGDISRADAYAFNIITGLCPLDYPLYDIGYVMLVWLNKAGDERRIHTTGLAMPLRYPTVMPLAGLIKAVSRVATVNR